MFLKITLVNVLGVILGLLFFNLLKNSDYIQIDSNRMMEFKYIGESFRILSSQMWLYITDFNFKTLIIVVSFVVFMYTLIVSTKKILKQKSLITLELYFILSFIFTAIVFIAPVINGNYTGYDTLRYNIYVFYLLIINSGIIIYSLIQKIYSKSLKLLNSIIILFIIAGIINIVYQFDNTGLKNYFNYYPKEVECIDKISKKEKLYCGLANYWKAKKITMFSKNGVRVYTSINALNPWYHVMNETWFKKNQFNFIIPEEDSEDSLINNYFNGNIKIKKSDTLKVIITPIFIINSNNKIEYK